MASFAVHPVPQRSDAELLDAHTGGDPYAFAELFDRHRQRLGRVAGRRSSTPEDAADALQDAMLAAHRGAGQFRHQAAVSSWLHRIVVNACVDLRRRAGAVTAVSLDETQHGVVDRTGQIETAIMVRRAILALPPEQQAAVLAVDIYGHSVGAAADLLGVAEGTVKSRRARARVSLAATLGPLQESSAAAAGH